MLSINPNTLLDSICNHMYNFLGEVDKMLSIHKVGEILGVATKNIKIQKIARGGTGFWIQKRKQI